MSRFVSLLSSMLLLAALAAHAEDRRSDPSRLVIMTLNAEFLWDGESPEEGRVEFPWKGNRDEARDHMRDIAGLIAQSDPDLVNLVEVESEAAARRFNSDFLAGRGYAVHLVKGRDTFTGQDVALLTRIDPDAFDRTDRDGESRTVSGETVTKSVSKNYFAKLDVGGHRIAVLGLHFLARPHDASRLHPRQAQADAIRDQAVALNQEGYEIVVLGDFNDYDGNDDARDHVDNVPISRVLDIVREMDPANVADNLRNAAELATKADRYTAFWDRDEDGVVDQPGEHSSIDHILLSPGLFDMAQSAAMPHTHDPRIVTDHYPVVVTLALAATPATRVRIVRLLPNPEGDENQLESVTLRNDGPESIDLTGWRLRDRAQRQWQLTGLGHVDAGGAEVTILRGGQPMALNNGGDEVSLLDANGNTVHRISYGSAPEGEEMVPVTE